MKSKILGCLILAGTVAYVHGKYGDDPLHLWTSTRVLEMAYNIDLVSEEHLEVKHQLNEMALHAAPTPWLLKQRIVLREQLGQDTSREEERLWIIFKEKK